jgi:predicted SnoaL-like aldol condensation-catalyzing enzyme
MKFERNEIIEFKGVPTFSAKKGAKAVCKGYFRLHDDEMLDVEWIRNGDDNGQVDGGYHEAWFTTVGEVSTQEEDRILDEIKKEKVMKFDLEKGKEGLVEYFQGDFDRATEYSLEYIKSCDDMDLIESEVKSFRAFKEEHNKMIGRIEYATTLSQIFSALDDTALEDDDETILSFFIKELQ